MEPTTYRFANAYWFRVPLKVLVLAVTVFGLVSIVPSLTEGTTNDHERALFGLAVMLLFDAMAITVAVAINDSTVEVDDAAAYIRFEAFFHAVLPIDDIVAVRRIDPRPAWRFRFGLSTNFEDRIACSHGGEMIEIVLARPQQIQLWPRRLSITTFWIAVDDADGLLADIEARRERVGSGSVPMRLAA